MNMQQLDLFGVGTPLFDAAPPPLPPAPAMPAPRMAAPPPPPVSPPAEAAWPIGFDGRPMPRWPEGDWRIADWHERDASHRREEAARKAGKIELLAWGNREGHSGNNLRIELWHDVAGWRSRHSFTMPNMGSSGPFGEASATRDEALLIDLRTWLLSVARHLNFDQGSVFHGKHEDWHAIARWLISLAPSPMFGGPDLEAEFDRHMVEQKARWEEHAARCWADHERKQREAH